MINVRKGLATNMMFMIVFFVVVLIVLIIAYLLLLSPYSGENMEAVTGTLQGGLFG